MAAPSKYYDALETRDQEDRIAALSAALPKQIAHAQSRSTAYGRILAGVNAADVNSVEALAQLPVTRKSELMALQAKDPPFGGLAAVEPGELMRVFASPGPIYEPQGRGEDFWRFGRSLYAAGFRKGDLVHNTFSYHFTPAGMMAEGGAFAIGCAVFPAGVGQTELQVQTIAQLRPQGYVGTPSFLNIILDKGAELGADLSSMSKALVGGEALPASLRGDINKRGVSVLQCYATADLGLIAYESDAQEGLIVDEGVIVEIVRPGTGDPAPEGEVGEVVATLFNPDYPLIRFATGDMSAVMADTSPCGRTNMRIKGWMGRADQTAKVRGMFVHPSQVADVLKRHTEISKGRLVVGRSGNNDTMTLQCEVHGAPGGGLGDAIVASMRDVCKLRGEVEFVAADSLPNDGKVIDDTRPHE